MVRLFYTILLLLTALAASILWSNQEPKPTWGELIGVRQAQANPPQSQFPPPTTGGYPTSFAPGIAPPPSTTPAVRPHGWPGSVPQPGVGPQFQLPPEEASNPEQELEGARRIAQVGTEFILLADVSGQVNDILARNADRIPKHQIDQFRMQLIRQRLEQMIETKMVIAEARRKVPAENLKKIESRIGEQFDANEVPKAMERSKVANRAELENQLRSTGSSLERERRAYVERMLSMSWIQQNVKIDEEVTHEQMLAFYQSHAAEFDREAKARWQHIQIRFDRFPNKAAAYQAIAQAGNQILGGADFAATARAVSHGWTADKGGEHDWTTQGSLSSDVLDHAIFHLPVNTMSPILEDKSGFHIVRVVERVDAGRQPFLEAQVEIKQKIKQERVNEGAREYLAKLQKSTVVWTIFDEPQGGAAPTAGVAVPPDHSTSTAARVYGSIPAPAAPR